MNIHADLHGIDLVWWPAFLRADYADASYDVDSFTASLANLGGALANGAQPEEQSLP